MKNKQQVTMFFVPEYRLAQLMGITQKEFTGLRHRGLSAVVNKTGEIVNYYLKLSARNNKHILEKIRYDKHMRVYFDAIKLEIDI